MIFRKYPTYRLPSTYRWYIVPTERPEAKQAHAPEIFAIPAEDLREDKKSSQYLPSWDFRLFVPHRGCERGEGVALEVLVGLQVDGARGVVHVRSQQAKVAIVLRHPLEECVVLRHHKFVWISGIPVPVLLQSRA